MKTTAFCDMAASSVIDRHQFSERSCCFCLHLWKWRLQVPREIWRTVPICYTLFNISNSIKQKHS